MGYEGQSQNRQRPQSEDLWYDRGMADASDCRRISLRVRGWRVSEAKLGGEVQNVSVLVAVEVNQDGCREILGIAAGSREDKESWSIFLR